MFADLLVWDDFNRGEVEEELSGDAQIRDRIMALNGDSRSLVTIYGDGAHLAVGGDAANGVVVYATFDNEVFNQLIVDVADGDREITVVAGGQPGGYAARYVVPVDQAMTAALTFADDGRLDESLTWTGQ